MTWSLNKRRVNFNHNNVLIGSHIISFICSQRQCNIDMADILFVCGGLVLTSHSLSGHQVDLP